MSTEHVAELADRGRLPGALQTDDQDNVWGGSGEAKILAFSAENGHQLLVDDLDDLLARRKRPRDFLAERLLLYCGKEVLDDAKVDVSFE